MKPDKLVAEISAAYTPERLDNLERRANLTPMSPEDRAAVKRAFADRRAYLSSPTYKQALARAI
jgi:hypothetical protein